MENILPKRVKHLIKPIVIAALILGFGALVYFTGLFKSADLDDAAIYKSVSRKIHAMESALQSRLMSYQQRADNVFRSYLEDSLSDSDIEPREALIIEKDGVITHYYGEIYHFRALDIDTGGWIFTSTRKKEHIYFARKMADHIYYFRFFCHVDDNSFLGLMRPAFPASEFKLFNEPLDALNNMNKYVYDDIKEIFFYYHLLNHSNNQLVLHLRFSKLDFESYYKKNRSILFCSILSFLLVLGILYFFKSRVVVSRVLWFVLLANLYILLPLLGKKNFYLKVMGITLSSLYQVLIIAAVVISAFYFARKAFKNRVVSFILFNVFLAVTMEASGIIFDSVEFNYREFGPDYFLFLTLIFLLHILPLFFIRGIAHEFYKSLSDTKKKIGSAGLFFLLQVSAVSAIHLVFGYSLPNLLLISAAAPVFLFFRRSLLTRMAVLFLLAISIYHLMFIYSLQEKRDFVENSLKNIFLNQSNYARFIANEIIYEINYSSGNDYARFFNEVTSGQLKKIWGRTIASSEDVASGIFLQDKNNRLLSYFDSQMPFLDLQLESRLPVWSIGESSAEIYGKEVSVSYATMSVYQQYEYLGQIVILVMNSPELLLRYQDEHNIFTIDNRVRGSDLSYVKLNKENQIIENPSNINVENLVGIVENDNRWVRFESMEIKFSGYVFRGGEHTNIIFFPRSTLVKDFAEIIKIFLLFCGFLVIFYLRYFRRIDWRSLYYSFSMRVFFFLIVISMVTAIVFSVFFINFSSRTTERKVMRMIYETGRIAQNVSTNLMLDNNDYSRGYLLSMSEILNSDVSIYHQDGKLVEASNTRKIINLEIPDYIHSGTLRLLNDKKQKFVLFEDEKRFRLFYKIFDNIFLVEFSNKWEKSLSEEGIYKDFIITIFFLLVIIGFSVAFFFRNKILSPIQGLNAGMSEVERGQLPTFKNVPSEIELKSLYMGFNAMIEGIREQKRNISEISRMRTVIRMGRRVAHEVKNPLTPIKLSAEQILRALQDKNPNYEDIIKQSVHYIIDETEHLKKVSYGFLDLSKLDEIEAEEFNLMDLVQDEMFTVNQVYAHIRFDVETVGESKRFPVILDKIKIKQVLKNLINNSIEAIGEKKGEIRVKLEQNKQRVKVEVTDNGIGMAEEEFARAFEVDYSTKDVGTGLGLFIVKRIIELHKGRIEIQSEKNKGTSVVLDLPVNVAE
jgi:signal transduction histidine kinase